MPLPLIFGALAKAGLSLIGNAVLAKGKEVIEDKLGVKIPDDPSQLTPEKAQELQVAQMKHEEFLIEAALKETELQLEAEKVGEQERTKRWEADAHSDSWLSKNIRPLSLVYISVVITLLAFADKWLQLDAEWIALFKAAWLTALGGYFLIRGGEKVTSMITKMKEKTNGARS